MFIEYQNGEKHAGSNAAISESMDSFQDCGLLLTNEDIVIDIDHVPKETIKAALSEFGIITQTIWTDRGAHLWFKKPAWFTRRRDGVCRLGFEIEQHNRSSNPNGMTVKRNGIERQIDNFGKQCFLPPIFKIDTKCKYANLTGLNDGEGRNKALFAHRMNLQRNSAPDVERICAFINRHVFAEPLPEAELEGILRDAAADESTNRQSDIASVIMHECMTTIYSGMTWWYRNGEYLADENDQNLIRRVYAACEGEKTSFVDEVIVVNDGSSDNTSEIVTSLISKYPRLRFIDLKENCGKANALYLGLIASKGEILLGVDSDSYVMPDALNYMVPHFTNRFNGERVGAVTGNPRVRNRSSLLAKIQLCEYSSIISLIKRTQRVWGKVMTVSGVVVAFRKRQN